MPTDMVNEILEGRKVRYLGRPPFSSKSVRGESSSNALVPPFDRGRSDTVCSRTAFSYPCAGCGPTMERESRARDDAEAVATARAPAAGRAATTAGRNAEIGSPDAPVLNPRWTQALRVLLLASTDLLALWLSSSVAYLLWARAVHGQAADMYLGLAPLLTLFLAGYLAADLYPGFGLGPVESLRRTWLVTAFGFLVLAAFTFAIKLPHLYSRVTFAIALALSLIAVPALALSCFPAPRVGDGGASRWW